MTGREAKERSAMRAHALKTTNRTLLVLVMIAAGLGVGSSSVSAAPVSINLCEIGRAHV